MQDFKDYINEMDKKYQEIVKEIDILSLMTDAKKIDAERNSGTKKQLIKQFDKRVIALDKTYSGINS